MIEKKFEVRKYILFLLLAGTLIILCSACSDQDPVILTDFEDSENFLEIRTDVDGSILFKELGNAKPGMILEETLSLKNPSKKYDYVNVYFRILPKNWDAEKNLVYDISNVKTTIMSRMENYYSSNAVDNHLKDSELIIRTGRNSKTVYDDNVNNGEFTKVCRIDPGKTEETVITLKLADDLTEEDIAALNDAEVVLIAVGLNEDLDYKISYKAKKKPANGRYYTAGEQYGTRGYIRNTGNVRLIHVTREVKTALLTFEGTDGGDTIDPGCEISLDQYPIGTFIDQHKLIGYVSISISIVGYPDNPDLYETDKIVFNKELKLNVK